MGFSLPAAYIKISNYRDKARSLEATDCYLYATMGSCRQKWLQSAFFYHFATEVICNEKKTHWRLRTNKYNSGHGNRWSLSCDGILDLPRKQWHSTINKVKKLLDNPKGFMFFIYSSTQSAAEVVAFRQLSGLRAAFSILLINVWFLFVIPNPPRLSLKNKQTNRQKNVS